MTTEKINTTDESEVEQFLTFELAGEFYGVEILAVQEIRGWEPVREIPNTPDFIKGALNLRGSIVPIIDLRERFGMESVEYSAITVVIVLSVKVADDTHIMGIVSDTVSDVVDINKGDIKQAPKLGSKIDTRYMQGMYIGKEHMIMLLDVDKLLNLEEIESIVGI